ncbi:hypothetical protein [Flavobacterium sp.]|jgi:Na+-transporting NADH:ubiquinone oxidoreductase subunit NqrD|uniref:hypothetical protein n=1 Tax=Flavobacterium sp. TaxID=239 RepID=UPI0037BFDE64
MIKKATGSNNKKISLKIAGIVAALSIDQKYELAIQIKSAIGNNKVPLNEILFVLLKNNTEKIKIAVLTLLIAIRVGNVIKMSKKGKKDLFIFCSSKISCQAFAKKL